jgi:hypothetical protein
MSKKDILEKGIIPFLKESSAYFSYKKIGDLFKKKKIKIAESSLKRYLFSLVKQNRLYDAGKGWYSSIEKSFVLNKEPIKVIIKTLNKNFPLLAFSCWSTEQLNHFTHHILSKFITFIYTDTDFTRNVAEVLRNNGYNVYENPYKIELKKHFTINDKTVILRPSITKQPENIDNTAPIEKVLVDFLIENKKLKIMEDSEVINVVKKAINSGRINMAALQSYAKRRDLSPTSYQLSPERIKSGDS